ncbi:protein-glutamine glutaminase family protein [uncultured Legionella sp.]|uniref:protein-glutamine glutaminase family protein n=1 Tax=uncultured Legionella sp. TaxID=210934 RepID=UPI0026141715|nr:protein-glutamine glutaminase family protein [uncultured Legionella sp.]
MDFSLVPVVATYDEMMHLFNVIRDTRFLHTEDNPEFDRRISWLYPDDGCFARAALSIIELEKEQLLKPAKIFVFGNLLLKTPYSLRGYVYWWYHVSIAVNYMGTIYILDPALNHEKPLFVDDWFAQMGSEMDLRGAVCNSSAYVPFDYCLQDSDISEERVLKDGATYLELEWERISLLGFEPLYLLGNNPPWIPDSVPLSPAA